MRWLLLFAALNVSTAWSIDPVNPLSKGEKQQAAKEQRGTEKEPLFVKVEVTTHKSEAETANETTESKEKALVDAALVKYTALTALFTFTLAFIALIQAGLFVWQLRLMRKGTKDAEDVAKAALVSAQTARDEFIATHRPRIRVKHVWLEGDILGDSEIKVSLVVVNHGDTSARHLQGEISTTIVQNRHRLPAKPFFAGNMVFTTTVAELPSGITLEFAHLTDHRKLSTDDWINLRSGYSFLYCYGYVDYLDAANRLRRTTFCRALCPTAPGALLSNENARFAKLDPEDEDYEYQD